MNSPLSPAPRRRRRWPWVLAVLLSPVLLLAIAATSYLTLNRDASALRREVMAATDAGWNTQLQLSAGRLTFWVVRGCLAFVPDEKIGEARAALNAVRSVSVGVYRPVAAPPAWSREKLFNETDRTMQDRGWTRLVGVADKSDHVLIYVPTGADEVRRICLAVVSGRELVVVSAAIDPEAVTAMVAKYAGRDLNRSLASLRI
jgi:hypothetical protein